VKPGNLRVGTFAAQFLKGLDFAMYNGICSTLNISTMQNPLTFRQVATLWREDKHKYVKRSTMSAYSLILQNHLLPYFADATAITEEQVQKFAIEKLDKGLSQKSVKDILIVLKMIFRFGVKSGNFTHQDWEVKFPTDHSNRELSVLTVDNQRKLMKHLTDNFTFRNLGILICLHTGMRIGEICALKWSDINLSAATISVNKTLERIYISDATPAKTEIVISSPKTTNSRREIPIGKGLLKILRPIMAVVNSDFYVITNEAKPTEPRTYRNYYKHLMESLNLPAMKFHGLRHSFATRCIESMCDYKTVSVILGHSNIATTLNLYVHPNMEQKKKCIDKMLRSL